MARLAFRIALASVVLVGAGLSVAVTVMAYVDYSESHWTPQADTVISAVFLLVVLLALILEFKRQWNRPILWFALVAIAGIHILGWKLVVHLTSDIRPLWMGLVTPLETAVFVNVVDVALNARGRLRTRSSTRNI